MKTVKEKLQEITFHDLQINSLSIEFFQERLTIIVLEYDEESLQDYNLKISFQNISKLYMSEFNHVNIEEIYSCDLKLQDSSYEIRFRLIGGPGEPDWVIQFNFEDVTIHSDLNLS